jgi:hypothetical protein
MLPSRRSRMSHNEWMTYEYIFVLRLVLAMEIPKDKGPHVALARHDGITNKAIHYKLARDATVFHLTKKRRYDESSTY